MKRAVDPTRCRCGNRLDATEYVIEKFNSQHRQQHDLVCRDCYERDVRQPTERPYHGQGKMLRELHR